jgi:hypothetical protein
MDNIVDTIIPQADLKNNSKKKKLAAEKKALKSSVV